MEADVRTNFNNTTWQTNVARELLHYKFIVVNNYIVFGPRMAC
jgi:hypothetical protein